jgi:hypothetical protein
MAAPIKIRAYSTRPKSVTFTVIRCQQSSPRSVSFQKETCQQQKSNYGKCVCTVKAGIAVNEVSHCDVTRITSALGLDGKRPGMSRFLLQAMCAQMLAAAVLVTG